MPEPTAQETLIRDFVRHLARKYGHDYWLAKAREGAFAEELWREPATGGCLGMVAPEEYCGGGFSTNVDLTTMWPFTRMLHTVPVSRGMVLNYIGEHVLSLPRFN